MLLGLPLCDLCLLMYAKQTRSINQYATTDRVLAQQDVSKAIRQHAKENTLSSVAIQSHFVQVSRRNGWAGVAQSVQRLATGWTVRGSNPRGGEIFLTSLDRPWGPPSLLYSGYRLFPGVKRPGRGVDHPLHLASRLKKEYSYGIIIIIIMLC